jgi:hypothetical protein
MAVGGSSPPSRKLKNCGTTGLWKIFDLFRRSRFPVSLRPPSAAFRLKDGPDRKKVAHELDTFLAGVPQISYRNNPLLTHLGR